VRCGSLLGHNQRRALLAGLLVVLLGEATARADDEPEPDPRGASANPAVPRMRPPPPPKPMTATPLDEHLQIPPGQPVAVPNPSPVVLGGVPTEPGSAAVPLRWKRKRFATLDTVIMLTGGAITLAAAIVPPSRTSGPRGPVFFDDDVRDVLRASSTQERYTFRDASDVGLSIAATWPFFVDALITAWWLRGSRDTAEQMALLGLETLAVSGAVQGTTNLLVGRERPYGETCGSTSLPGNAIDCTSSSHYRSFFSGHSSFSFTSAALICFNHMELDLLGPPWDAISCAGAYGLATTTASFRVVSDVHYASDVLTGALVGSIVGYGVPLLHFRSPGAGTITTGGLKMRLVPSSGGAGVVGIF
jgi:membrane-associated phospholipid phosphatase